MATLPREQETKLSGISALKDVKVYVHSPMLYWWPVWVVGLIMAAWTYLDGHVMVIVPQGALVHPNGVVVNQPIEIEGPTIRTTSSRIPGVVFVITLLVVAVFTSVWLRGPWALFVAACVSAAIFLIGWLDWWEPLYEWMKLLRIHVNLGTYVVISVVLGLVWALTVLIFDRWSYVVFSPGQIRFRREIGDEERVFDPGLVTLEKRPYDYFRWLVGFGAGDIILRIGGTHPELIELPNVVRAGKRLREMEERMRIKDVV